MKKLLCKIFGHDYFTDDFLDFVRIMLLNKHRYCSRCGYHEEVEDGE
ncbi:MAG: hypothetical protein H0X33_13315 [Taibaiella sp.]|nr:hypothetical protein [Taibaiella sp.]